MFRDLLIKSKLLSNLLILFGDLGLKPCLNGSNIVGPTSSNIVEIMAQTASFSNIFVKTRFRV